MAKDIYFTSGFIRGLGRLFFLRVPQHAPVDSNARRLLGSYVVEIDYGLFKLREAPALEHAWQPGYFLTQAGQVVSLQGVDLVLSADLAGFVQEYRIETRAGAKAKGSFPGAPVGVGLEIDYSKLKTAKVVLGEGSQKFYIPRDYILDAYRTFAGQSDSFHRVVFDSNRMLVDQIVIARNLSIVVESESAFGADFQARADNVNGLEGGVTFRRENERRYEIKVSDGRDYLFAIGAVQADKFAR